MVAAQGDGPFPTAPAPDPPGSDSVKRPNMSPIRYASIVTLVLTAGCGIGEIEYVEQAPEGEEIGQSMTWSEFLSRTFQEPESGVFIVDGDIPLENLKQLREFYEQHVRSGQLIIHRNGSVDAKWSDTQKLNLTYCVSTAFGSRYGTVVQAMADAAGAWEAAANVDFIHVSSQDSNCTASNNNVLFDVRPVNVYGQYLARAFFPDDSRAYRNVLIDNSAFTSSGDPTLTGILRHELGHTLGFRHEHTRPEARTCYEDSQWRALTSYDPNSVMHYPHCNGTGDWTLSLTALDKMGAAAVYGEPGSGNGGGGDDDGITRNATASGSVAQGAWQYYAPLKVVPGTSFVVEMSGSGDPDLYVRFGAQPTTSTYHCRPYRAGASESCVLTVPSGMTEAYIGVRGYSASNYTLNVTWTEPVEGGGGGGAGTPKTASYSGSVTKSGTKHHGPLTVKAGTTFKVVMSGSGDPDLYVKFGSQPTTSSYDCRPYLAGANETCSLTVPNGVTSAYIMVRGYQAGSYSLSVEYTAP